MGGALASERYILIMNLRGMGSGVLWPVVEMGEMVRVKLKEIERKGVGVLVSTGKLLSLAPHYGAVLKASGYHRN